MEKLANLEGEDSKARTRFASEEFSRSAEYLCFCLFAIVAHKDSLQRGLAMFTGLIEEIGNVLWIRATERGTQLQIAAPQVAENIRTGDSLAVNGCCLTVTARRAEQITFDLLTETLDRTNLKSLRRDSLVNLERPLLADGRIGGHFVQGHIDCAARIISLDRASADHRLEIELPAEFAHYAASKGSIAINGISFTVAEILPKSFAVFVIPHTRRSTNLSTVQNDDLVNLEFDVLAKYLQRMLPRPPAPG
ncbi:MAG: riboflavin synthase [Verrucomicrobiota bacterium]|nr:riboflavin synthase [Verrucomicrobiota bacterium]